MSEAELKQKLHEAIDKADHRLLTMVNALMEAYDDDSVTVGYTVNGEPISRKALKQRVEEAETQIAKGDYISQESLEKASQNW